jgi:hypothetical protein
MSNTKLSNLFRNLYESNHSKYEYNYSSRIKNKHSKEQKINGRVSVNDGMMYRALNASTFKQRLAKKTKLERHSNF